MNYTAELVLTRHGAARPARFWATLVLSLLLHLSVVLLMPKPPRSITPEDIGEPTPLSVKLAPPPAATLPEPARPAAQPPLAQRAPAPAPRPQPAPPIAIPTPGPSIPIPAPPLVAEIAPTPTPPSTGGDLASYIEARRRASGEPAPAPAAPAEDENMKASRLAAANLRLTQPPMGKERTESGGIFHVKHKSYDYADLLFYGWHLEIRRAIPQQFDVRKGDNATIELAVVRKMIEIIRQYEKEEFTFHSRRQGRSLKLSARLRDTASLEQFLLREFF